MATRRAARVLHAGLCPIRPSCERNERHMPWRTRPLQSKRQLKNSLISRTSGNHANCTIASILSWFTSCLIEGVEEWLYGEGPTL